MTDEVVLEQPQANVTPSSGEEMQPERTFSPLCPAPAAPRRALITGAASGIGRCIAKECAQKGWPLVLVDINAEGLAQVANDLRAAHGVEIHTLVLDLSAPTAAEQCIAFCDQNQLEIDFLANVAGVFIFDPLLDANPKKTALMLDLHVKTVTRMCVQFGDRMRQRRYGFIMNMSSLSAWMPMPGIATYNASKSYVRSLSQSLRFELKPWNVSVTVVCPGGCNTPLLPLPDKLRNLAVKLGFLMQPETLAKKAVRATLKRKGQTIPGLINYLIKGFILITPNCIISLIMKCLPIYKKYFPNN